MASPELYNCQIWQLRKGQIDDFNGMCVVDAVQKGQIPCIHFMEKTELIVKNSTVPRNCFIANLARKLPPII